MRSMKSWESTPSKIQKRPEIKEEINDARILGFQVALIAVCAWILFSIL